MRRIIVLFINIVLVLTIVFWLISFNHRIDMYWNGVVVSSNTVFIFIIIFTIIIIFLILQRIYLFFRNYPKKIKGNMEVARYKNAFSAIVRAITAIASNDNRELITQSKRIDNYVKDNPIGLILRSEVAKKEKNFKMAEDSYNKMLLNSDTKILGLKGLLEQNLKLQDYHHAMIYAEQIYRINPKLEWIYDTMIQIIIKTKNWYKMIDINNDAQNKKIISKDQKNKSNSIAMYEIGLIKESASFRESIKLISDAHIARSNFPPFVKKLLHLLIEDNQISKAKKILFKAWSDNPHPSFFEETIKISKNENIKPIDLINKLTKNNTDHYDSIIFKVKANIIENNWEEAKKIIKPILSNRPTKTVCKLMADIEHGITGNMQRANSWINRSTLGDPEKIWVCKITGIKQEEWASVNQGGIFDSLEWTWPNTGLSDNTMKLDALVPNIIGYN